MKKFPLLLSLLTAINLLLSGCASQAIHPALVSAKLPDIIPVRDFVADREANGGYQISPDGKKLAWYGVDLISPVIKVKTLGKDDVKSFHILPRYFKWTADSKRLLFVADSIGDENTHIFAGIVDGPDTAVIDLTPFEKTVSQIARVIDGGSEIVAIENRRDKKVFDLYRIDAASGMHTLLESNPGNVVGWGVDRKGRVLGRISQSGENHIFEAKTHGLAEGWQARAAWSTFEYVYLLDFTEDENYAWVLSNRGRDKAALVKFDLKTGKEEAVYSTSDVDVDFVLISKKRSIPLAALSMPDYPRVEIFEPNLKEKIAKFIGDQPATVFVGSADDEERLVTLSVVTDRGAKFYLYDVASANSVLLGEDSLSRLGDKLSRTKPISFQSRDGLTIHGYLTLPQLDTPHALPMVLLVHGGPWARDRWGTGETAPQFLANRGYAVLQVNYRGSSGYGRSFMEKAVGEFAGKMHDDLIDGVNWAIQAGIADPKRVGVFGGSYGGYATLVALTFTPDVFACGVDAVGPTDLARLLETVPPYWELGKPWWTRYVGDPANPDDRQRMNAKSPLFRADKMTKPVLILHGVNDPRVKLEQSQLMVEALKKAGKEVEFVTFSGDGHGNQKWANKLTQYRRVEDFFAGCLGGRSSGFDFYQLGSWAF